MKRHLSEPELALFAGGDFGPVQRFFLNRHVKQCRECLERIEEYELLLLDVAQLDPALPDWDRLAREMRANIRLGLEAGECVRDSRFAAASPVMAPAGWSPGLAVACVCLLLLAFAGILLHPAAVSPVARHAQTGFVLESTNDGVELRGASGSIKLLNRRGSVSDQSVSAQGEIRARMIDGETGTVTINNVSLE